MRLISLYFEGGTLFSFKNKKNIVKENQTAKRTKAMASPTKLSAIYPLIPGLNKLESQEVNFISF